MNRSAGVEAIRAAAVPLSPGGDHSALLDAIGDGRFVLLGEASHGTHEFYRERARITQRLIAERGFRAVAVEGDWPDAYRVNAFVRGTGRDASADEALAGFERFPTWMWRNADVLDFVGWLRAFDAGRAHAAQCGFYGLDMYSLHASMARVLAWLERHRPEVAPLARERYACFDRFGDDSQVYGMMTGLRGAEGCEEEVVAMLVDVQRAAAQERTGPLDAEAAFDAEQNARLVRNAESYYRGMYMRNVSSWNQRDTHMAGTLDAIEAHLGRSGLAKVVVWAHNSHVGDARATEMGQRRGELTLGQLVRERHGGDAFLVGFTTHRGTVAAASDWDAPLERKAVVPSLAGSVERLLHDTGIGRFMLPLRGDGAHVAVLRQRLLERAIGVIYRPETERQSHYFEAEPAGQFDALVHIDATRAVRPLEAHAAWDAASDAADLPDTYPFAT
jgi:erythromycin esterase-like protein